jgi:hypothetical protein
MKYLWVPGRIFFFHLPGIASGYHKTKNGRFYSLGTENREKACFNI